MLLLAARADDGRHAKHDTPPEAGEAKPPGQAVCVDDYEHEAEAHGGRGKEEQQGDSELHGFQKRDVTGESMCKAEAARRRQLRP